jgi:uncharacterized membrane protein YfcA
MMIGTVIGGALGIQLTKTVDPKIVRGLIISCGVLMTLIYIYRYWL